MQVCCVQGKRNEENASNTCTAPSTSGNAHRIFRKSSIGFVIPLPKKVKLPTLSTTSDGAHEDEFVSERVENGCASKRTSESSRKLNEHEHKESIKKENINLNIQSSKNPINQNSNNLNPNYVISHNKDMTSKSGYHSRTVDEASKCEMCPQKTVVSELNQDKGQVRYSQRNEGPCLKQASASSQSSKHVDPIFHARAEDSTKNALSSSPQPKRHELKHPDHLQLKSKSDLLLDEAPKYPDQGKHGPLLKPGLGALQKSIIKSETKTPNAFAAGAKKISDCNQVDQWRTQILQILEDAIVESATTEKKHHSTSDPIESDSGHTSAGPGKSNPKGQRVEKAPYRHEKKRSLNSQSKQTSTKNPREETETEKDSSGVCIKNTLEKDEDVFCFENNQQSMTILHKLSADRNQENHEFSNELEADYMRTPFKPTVDNLEVSHMLKRPSCSVQGREEGQTGPVKKLRLSPNTVTDSELLINPDSPRGKLLDRSIKLVRIS
jgi:hypothetical protein